MIIGFMMLCETARPWSIIINTKAGKGFEIRFDYPCFYIQGTVLPIISAAYLNHATWLLIPLSHNPHNYEKQVIPVDLEGCSRASA
jgi:hypothetical protein